MSIHIALIYHVNYTESSLQDPRSLILCVRNDRKWHKENKFKSEKNIKHVRGFYYIKISYIIFLKFTKIYL